MSHLAPSETLTHSSALMFVFAERDTARFFALGRPCPARRRSRCSLTSFYIIDAHSSTSRSECARGSVCGVTNTQRDDLVVHLEIGV